MRLGPSFIVEMEDLRANKRELKVTSATLTADVTEDEMN